ncbi:MAG: hypothetical protein JRH01_19980 [Deltaproteobacteria bacterium]|nr:hypothetical protein [Deltaproteobacteria bacterium]MBW2395485.1 hypothetical protein [Deltaproteobacteria bacterium]
MKAARPMVIALGVILLVLVLHLVLGDHPWEEGAVDRRPNGKPIRPIDLWIAYGYWVAAGVAVVTTALLATVHLWFDRLPAPERVDLAPPPRPSKWVIGAVLLAVLTGIAAGAPRMDESLWDDELYNVRRSIWGGYVEDPRDGQLEAKAVKLRDAFWYYRKPNNHVVHTLLARASVSVWAAVTDPPLRFVSETALRIPAMLAGAGSIAAVAWLLWRLGFAGAGVIAAWILALHPWHIRYLSEARGYSLAMCLVSVTLLLAVAVCRRGTWRRWITFGVGQLLLLWTYPATLYHVLLLNAVVVGFLWARDRGTPAFRSQLTRLVFVGLAGALFFGLMMTPNLVQYLDYAETRRGHSDIGLRFLREVGGHMLAGVGWGRENPEAAFFYPRLGAAPAALVGSVIVLSVSSLFFGAFRLARAGGLRAGVAAVLLLAAPLTWFQSYLRADHLYVWYLSFALPPAAILVALGLDGVGQAFRKPWAGGALAILFLGLCFALAWPVHHTQWTRPYFPLRDSVELTRPNRDPLAPENQRITTVGWTSGPSYYDPLVQAVRTTDELLRHMREAEETGNELYVNLGRLSMAWKRHEDLMRILEDGERFEKVAVLPGFTEDRTRHVWRLRPPPAAAAR